MPEVPYVRSVQFSCNWK